MQKVLLILRTETLDHTIKRMILFQSRPLKQHPATFSRLSKEGQIVEEMFFHMNRIICMGRPDTKKTVWCKILNQPDHYARPVERGQTV